MQSFKIIQPSLLLQRYVRYYWVLQSDMLDSASERTLPTGCIQLFFCQPLSLFKNENIAIEDLEDKEIEELSCIVLQAIMIII